MTRWCEGFSCRALFWLPLEFVEPVVEIIDRLARDVLVQMFKAKSLDLDLDVSVFIEELYFSRRGIRLPMPHLCVTP